MYTVSYIPGIVIATLKVIKKPKMHNNKSS